MQTRSIRASEKCHMPYPPFRKQDVIFSPSARNFRPVFLSLQKCHSTKCHDTFSQQLAGRHNTLDFAYAKSCAKWGAPPLETPINCLSLAHQFVQSYRFDKLMSHFRQYKSRKISSTSVWIFYSFCEKRAAAKRR